LRDFFSKHFYIALLCVCLSAAMKGQSFSEHPVSVYPDVFVPPPFDEKAVFEEYLQKHERYFKFTGRRERYAHHITEMLSGLNRSFVIYNDLKEETDYLNKVLKEALPDSLLTPNVSARIIRDPSVNAFSIEDGSLNFHIGFLSIVNSETELAAVMAHEYGHYEQKHMRRRYKKFSNVMLFNTVMSFIPLYGLIGQTATTAELFHTFRKHEKRCDQYAVDFNRLNNYYPTEISRPFRRFYSMEKLDKIHRDHEKSYDMFRTHPANSKRIKRIEQQINQADKAGRKNFLVDSLLFFRLKKRAGDEVIYQLFVSNHFDQCMEQCYLRLLEQPDDEFYMYYLLESLRLKLAIQPSVAKEAFITFNYKVKGTTEVMKSIHHQLPVIYAHVWEDVKNKLKGELSDPSNIEFITYGEALAYFRKRATEKCKACYPALLRMGEQTGVPDSSQHITALQKLLHEEISFSKAPAANKTPVFFNNSYSSMFDSRRYSVRNITSDDEEIQMLKEYINSQAEEQKTSLDSIYRVPLNFREENLLHPQLEVLSDKIIYSNFHVKRKFRKKQFYKKRKRPLRANAVAYEMVPALNQMMQSRGYNSLVFVDFLVKDLGKDMSGGSRKKLNALLYYYDLTSGQITRKFIKYKYKFMSELELKYFYPQLFSDIDLFTTEMKSTK
jgi:Zn-dependent protease with chaperone function